MSLNQEISLESLGNLFGGKKKKRGGALKTTINFVGIEEKQSNWKSAIPGVLLFLLVAALFWKFAILNRFEKVDALQQEAEDLQTQIDVGMAQFAETEDISEQFYHYTWTGMSEEEMSRESRVKVATLVNYINGQGLSVKSYVLSGYQLNVAVTGSSLDQISQVVGLLSAQEIVENCSVMTAQTYENAEEADSGVDARLIIYIRSVDIGTDDGILTEEVAQ